MRTDKILSLSRLKGYAVAAAAGNAIPLPRAGIAVDTITMTNMTMALAGVFGGSIPETVAKSMTINAIKQVALKAPMFGKPDDCYELTTFRAFCDEWLVKQPDGQTLLDKYYSIAPKIASSAATSKTAKISTSEWSSPFKILS